jgi:nitric oxide reductase NorQ protein
MQKQSEARQSNPQKGNRDLSKYKVAPDGFTLVLRAEAVREQLSQRVLREKPSYTPFGEEMQVLSAAAKMNLPVILLGGEGVGKTTSVQRLAYNMRVPFTREIGSEDMRKYDLTGWARDIENLVFWDDGILSRCARSEMPNILYLDEAIGMPKGVFTSVSQAFDNNRLLPLAGTGEDLSTKDTLIILSFNPPRLEEMDLLPRKATIDRFVVLRYPRKTGDEAIKVLRAKYFNLATGNGMDEMKELTIQQAFEKYEDICRDIYDELNGDVFRNNFGGILHGEASTRSIEKALLLISAGLNPQTAIMCSMINGLSPIEDPNTEKLINAGKMIVEQKLGQR